MEESKPFISCGKLSSLYLYVLYSITFKCLNDFILTFQTVNAEKKGGFFGESELNNHILLKSFYKYISFMIFGKLFLYFIDRKKSEDFGKQKELIYNNPEQKISISNITYIYLAIICLLYVLYLELIEISYSLGFHDYDLWIFNIVFFLLFMQIYHPTKIFKHQSFSLLFIFFTNFIILIIQSFYPRAHNVYDWTNDILGNKFYSILFYLIYIINSCMISFSRVFAKVLMEFKYISPYTIIILIGIFGFIFTSILICISSAFTCRGTLKEKICNVANLNYQTTDTNVYYDSIVVYWNNMKYNFQNKKSKFWKEVIIIYPLNLFLNFMVFNYEILLTYYLNPMYMLISDSLYYGTKTIITFILNSKEKDDIIKFILYLWSNIFAFFGYLIFVEIIELNFCDLSENTRRAIGERGIRDTLLSQEINVHLEEEEDS